MALAGPHLVRAAVGEDVTQEQLGGSRVHCRVSGVGDLEVADDEECIAQIKRYLSFFPSHCEEGPPIRACADPPDRSDEALLAEVQAVLSRHALSRPLAATRITLCRIAAATAQQSPRCSGLV